MGYPRRKNKTGRESTKAVLIYVSDKAKERLLVVHLVEDKKWSLWVCRAAGSF